MTNDTKRITDVVIIHNLDGDVASAYPVTCEADCKDSTDRSAYREAVRLNDVITMGKTIAEPVRRASASQARCNRSGDMPSGLHVTEIENAYLNLAELQIKRAALIEGHEDLDLIDQVEAAIAKRQVGHRSNLRFASQPGRAE